MNASGKWAVFVLFVAGVLANPAAWAADPSPASGQLSGSAQLNRGAGLYHGKFVRFAVVDGLAIVEGDIVLGSADELARRLSPPPGSHPQAKGFAIDTPSQRWPKGASGLFEIPYVIEIDANKHVPNAVTGFNSTFAGFMRLVPRTIETDYVAFRLNLPADTPTCFSSLGRVGGRQVIGGPATCTSSALVHEIGHAVGLKHEHQRPDRDQYVIWAAQNTAKSFNSDSVPDTTNLEVSGAYDYTSIMHYSDYAFSVNSLPTFTTIPQGIPIGQRGAYSAGDIDAVRRLYGDAPSTITVTSDPLGLALRVDGQAVVTPQTFTWALNSTHTIDIEASGQTRSGLSYVFGRWNVDLAGDGLARRVIKVAGGYGSPLNPQSRPAITVYSAHFVRVYSFAMESIGDTNAAKAATTGTVSPQPVSYPGLTGSFFRENQLFTLQANVAAGTSFVGWFGSAFESRDLGYGSATLPAFADDFASGQEIVAKPAGSSAPLYRFRGRGSDGAVDGFTIQLDGRPAVRTPYTSAYANLKAGTAHEVLAPATQYRNYATARYVFMDWGGAPANPATVTIPGAGDPSREITANFAAQLAIDVAPEVSCAGNVLVTPPSALGDGYHPYNEAIAITAVPAPGWFHTGWKDDFSGTAPTQALKVRAPVYATAVFNTAATPFALTGTNRMFATVGEPEFDLQLYGSGFTPATQVLLNGSVRAATFIDGSRMTAHLVAADFAQPGEIAVAVQNTALRCSTMASTTLKVRAAGYALPATTPIVEYYNAALDHYFVTANPDEMAKLDNGTFKGWTRTTLSFNAFPADSFAVNMEVAKTVCRFYGNPSAGLDSHFYSGAKDECDAISRKFPDAWVFESSDVFQIALPDRTTGRCPAGTLAVYRLYNQRADVNHRYTTDTAVRTLMIGKGYIPEGYGPDGVTMCSPV